MLKFGCDRIFAAEEGRAPTNAELDAIIDRSSSKAAAAAAQGAGQAGSSGAGVCSAGCGRWRGDAAMSADACPLAALTPPQLVPCLLLPQCMVADLRLWLGHQLRFPISNALPCCICD